MSFWINLVLPIVILALSMEGVVFIINLVLYYEIDFILLKGLSFKFSLFIKTFDIEIIYILNHFFIN